MTRSDEPVLVTTAQKSPRQELRERERRYLITMGIRVLCLILAIVLVRGWLRAVAVVLALVLPWIAVVVANAGPKRGTVETPSLYARERRGLEPGERSDATTDR